MRIVREKGYLLGKRPDYLWLAEFDGAMTFAISQTNRFETVLDPFT